MQHQEKYTLHWHSYSDHLRESLNERMLLMRIWILLELLHTLHMTHENSANVDTEPPVQTEPITANNTTNKRYRRTEVVSGDAKFQCQDCDRVYCSLGAIWNHTKSKHQAAQKSDLKKHNQSIHEGVKYACNQCDQQFARHDNLKIHIQSKHKGVKYPCNQCDYQATQKNNLTTHIKMKHL